MCGHASLKIMTGRFFFSECFTHTIYERAQGSHRLTCWHSGRYFSHIHCYIIKCSQSSPAQGQGLRVFVHYLHVSQRVPNNEALLCSGMLSSQCHQTLPPCASSFSFTHTEQRWMPSKSLGTLRRMLTEHWDIYETVFPEVGVGVGSYKCSRYWK